MYFFTRFKQKINLTDIIGPHELVVFKYQDTFYRGRFFGGESEDHLFKVYLLDYGGIEKVPLKDIYEWHSICECIPGKIFK